MRVLVTGGAGNLGCRLIPHLLERGCEVSALYRSNHPDIPGVDWVQGDVTQDNLGIREPPRVDRIYHLAGSVKLGSDRKTKDEVFRNNSKGTYNVCKFVLSQGIPHIVYVSTAYLFDRNPYEASKRIAEEYVREVGDGAAEGVFGAGMDRIEHKPVEVAIFRPSIIISNPGFGMPKQAFVEFIRTIARVHYRMEHVRRKLEGTLALPPVEPAFRIKGNPSGNLNLILADDVAKAIAETDSAGTYHLTNPKPPKLSQLAEWVGEALMLRITVEEDFAMSPVERLFSKITKPFSPYLSGDNLPSDLKDSTPVTKGVVQGIAEKACLS